MMKDNYAHLMDYSYDALFQPIRRSGLTWLPWVGKDYGTLSQRFLVVAESHYSNNEDQLQEELDRVTANETETRECVWECPVSRDWPNNMYAYLHRALVKTNNIDGAKLWSRLAFYNFIQRPMEYTSLKERPRPDEFAAGWRYFIDIARVLRPKNCLFVGTTAANSFNAAMATLGVEYTPIEVIEYLNGAYMRKACITLDGETTSILFIRHTSSFFSWPEWHEQIKKYFPELIAELLDVVGPESPDEVERITPVTERVYTKDIPTWLTHKPILACSYPEFVGNCSEDEDAEFISVGRAQYNTKALSVKLWRRTYATGRWSRQSEEVPIHRLPYMMSMLLNAIIQTQQEEDGDFQSAAHEEFVVPDDKEFLKTELNRYREELSSGLRTVYDLLQRIDLSKL